MGLSLDGLGNVVLLFSDPGWAGHSTIPSTIVRNLTSLSKTLAYSNYVTHNLTVLTSKYSATDNGLLQGLLYVPDLAKNDPCTEYARQYVPDSVVRQSDLPPTNYNLIALAPWFNHSCTKAYLSSARVDPLRAFVFYLPLSDSSQPPEVDSDLWNLDDGGKWKTDFHYPVFAVSGSLGSEMMHQLSLYSGNVSQVPNGNNISSLYNPDASDYVRIWTQLSVHTTSNALSVWAFVLIIIGVLLAVVLSTIFARQVIWRRRRLSLQRRVASGEVNLEAMNIKRQTVPAHHVEKFLLFTYNYEPPLSPSQTDPLASPLGSPGSPDHSTSGTTAVEEFAALSTTLSAPTPSASVYGREKELKSPTLASHLLYSPTSPTSPSTPTIIPRPARSGSLPAASSLDYQPLCLICLEHFENRVTIIREISCGHIFHPDCIDEFLTEVSSLCPLCKTSMLPRGYAPPITNAMVRRERAVRRLRERVLVEESDAESALDGRLQGWGSTVKKHMNRLSAGSATTNDPRRSWPAYFHGSGRPPPASPGIELESPAASPAASPAVSAPNPRIKFSKSPSHSGVSEATRERMQQLASLGAERENTPTPKLKQFTQRLFAKFR